jgi:two-component system, OmpR family, sensor histidine kinase QseC
MTFRLVSTLLLAALLFGGFAGYASYHSALHENDEIFDAQLAQVAQTLLAIGAFADNEHTADPGKLVHKYQKTLHFQLWREENGELRSLLRSRDEMAEAAELPFFQNLPEGFSDRLIATQRWRFYRQRQAELFLDVVVAQNDMARDELAKEIAWHNVAPFIYGLPVLGLVACGLIFLGLRPLRRLAEELHRRTPLELSPLDLAHLPREMRPLVEAMNKLLLELSRTFERERRFTSDAAHELRTPLAGLRAQLELARFPDESPTARAESLSKAWLAALRMQHLVAQLLLLCRLDVSAHLDRASVRLDEIAERVCVDLAPAAVAKNIDLSLEAEAASLATGNRELLYALLRNLVDNAIRYTPEKGEIAVKISRKAEEINVEVSDSGCGVSQEDMQRLGQRFRRLSPAMAEGVGLGLSIVARVADLHRASVTYAHNEAGGGLRVSVRFPTHS